MFNRKEKNKFDEAMLSVDEALDRILKQIKVMKLISLIDNLLHAHKNP